MTSTPTARISLKLRELPQLFNSMDPSPFLERDLDHDAEEFILTWANEQPKARGYELTIHLATVPDPARAADLENAVRHYFATRAEIKRREFRVLLRHGHISLVIGLAFLATCLFASGLAGKIGNETAMNLVREGLVIAGWVAMWRPLETYLYDWWPVREEWRSLQRLSHMHVKLVLPHRAESTPAVTPPPTSAAGPD